MAEYLRLADDELLNRFIATGSEEAFAEILRRYGPLVHGVCRRYLQDASDRDDAWQATFFLLARKAKSIRRGGALASWLHGTARRVCSLALRRARRQPVPLEHSPATDRRADAIVLAEAREASNVLEEELGRLPARYRAPLLLSCLHGLAKPEIVSRLGLPSITVTGRLARGKALLRSRLARRGVAPAVTASLISGAATLHAWPTALSSATLAAATCLRAGRTGTLAPTPLALMKGVLTMSTLHRLQWTALFLFALLGVTLGCLSFLPAAQADDPQAAQPQYTDPELARDAAALQGRWMQRCMFSTNFISARHNELHDWIVFGDGKQSRESLYAGKHLECTVKLEKTPAGKAMVLTYKGRTADKREVESTHRILYSLDGDVLIQTLSPREEFPKRLGEAGNSRITTIVYQRLTDADVQSLMKRAGGPTRIQATKQLREIAIAMHNYYTDHAHLPQAALFSPDGKALLSWRVALLPYLNQKVLYNQFKLNELWDSDHNKALLSKIPPVYLHPDVDKDPAAGLTHYQVFTSPARQEPGRQYKFAPIFSRDPKFKLSLQQLTLADGTSNTVLLGEARQSVPWTKPEDILLEHDDAPLPQLGATAAGDDWFAAFGDGSVRVLLRTHPDTKLLRQIIGYNDGLSYDTAPIRK
jgi:RNA polymerase sigma factor (sigma-70 family)